MRNDVSVVVRNDLIQMATFTVPAGTKDEINAAIIAKLESGEVVWEITPKGLRVIYSSDEHGIWEPRVRRVPIDEPEPNQTNS